MISSLKSIFDLVRRRALFVCADRATVYHWERGRLGTTYTFAMDEAGLIDFNQYISEHPEDPVYMLVDFTDEEFKLDTIPHTGGADRRALVERKLSRLFRSAEYSCYEIHGRETEGRRDDRVLFSCLTNPDLIKPWVDILYQHKTPLAGIYSTALISHRLLPLLGTDSNNTLLVSLQRNAGLRQTYFKNNEFKFSRLVKLPRYGTAAYAPLLSDEIEKMLRFLRSMRLVSLDTTTRVMVVADKKLIQELKEFCVDGNSIQYQLIDIAGVADQIGLVTEILDPFAEELFIYTLLADKPANRYARSGETLYFRLRKLNNFLLTSSVFVLLGSLIWGSLNLIEGVTLKQQAASAREKSDFYNERYEIASDRLPTIPLEPEQIRNAVEIIDDLELYKSDPERLMQSISTGLDRFPNIQLSTIQWKASLDAEAAISGSPQAAQPRSPRGTDRSPEPDYIDEGQRYRYYELAEIQGYIEPFDGDFRNAIADINQFAEIVQAQPDVYKVKILNLPLDVSSTGKLQGTAEEISREATFSMRVVQGVGREN